MANNVSSNRPCRISKECVRRCLYLVGSNYCNVVCFSSSRKQVHEFIQPLLSYREGSSSEILRSEQSYCRVYNNQLYLVFFNYRTDFLHYQFLVRTVVCFCHYDSVKCFFRLDSLCFCDRNNSFRSKCSFGINVQDASIQSALFFWFLDSHT